MNGAIFSKGTPDIVSLIGLLLMLAGFWLSWKRHELRWQAEEAVKDGKLSIHAARRRIAWIRWRSIGLMGIGITMMIGAIVTLTK